MNLNIQNINVKSENVIIVGDFNSHSQSWGYNHIDNRGAEIEEWQDENNLTLIIDRMMHPHFTQECGIPPVHRTLHYVHNIFTET